MQQGVELIKMVEQGAIGRPLAHAVAVVACKSNKKPGLLDSLRPISVGSVWYRAYSHIRMAQLANWIRGTLPPELHGGVKNRGVHSALIVPLASLEIAQPTNAVQFDSIDPSRPRFLGSADLSLGH